MNLGLRDEVAVVMASTAGLGRSVAEALLDEGARVAICGRDAGRLASALGELRALHGERVDGRALDATRPDEVRAWLDDVRERWGDPGVLVTNTGGPPSGPAADVTPADLTAAAERLLHGPVAAVNALLPAMRARRFGRIVALTSSAVRQPIPGLSLSTALRAALTGWLKTLSQEVAADGVLVNTVCTGMFDTERLHDLFRTRAERSGSTPEEERRRAEADIPLGRVGDVNEFGPVVAFLCSRHASFVTGVALPVDGGSGRFLL